MDIRTAQTILLKQVGQPIKVDGDTGPMTRQAVRFFQEGYGRAGVRLVADGILGPATAAALERCKDEDGRLSEHFRFREFACKHCGWIKVHWSLPSALEVYRAHLSPGGLGVISGYRCPQHNAEIPGAASHSQHLYGTACDIAPAATVAQVRRLGVFSGIEYRKGGRVYHVDTRHAVPATNWSRSTVANPSVFLFG